PLVDLDEAGGLAACGLEPLRNICPVSNVPESLHVVGTHVEVVKVVRVLPHIQHQQRHGASRQIALLIEELHDICTLSERVPGEHCPTAALNAKRRCGEVSLKLLE